MLDKLYKPVTDLILNRYPISVEVSSGKEPPTVLLTITNHTPSIPVFIREVRVHYGCKERSRAFKLVPHTTVELKPKQTEEWYLSYEPHETIVTVRYFAKSQVIPQSDGPGIESPAQLFNAIGMGKANDSWVEIDFNEYRERRFLHRKIKNTFDFVGLQTRARRERTT